MNLYQRLVRNFHEKIGTGHPDEPTFDFKALQQRPLTLIFEETIELRDALRAEDHLEVIKELCDVMYVVNGFAVELGIDLQPFFKEVHASNMKKVGGPQREDGKQLKPEGWEPPRMKELYAAYMVRFEK